MSGRKIRRIPLLFMVIGRAFFQKERILSFKLFKQSKTAVFVGVSMGRNGDFWTVLI